MPDLPSIHSDKGLSDADSRHFITTRIQRSHDGQTMEFKIQQAVEDLKQRVRDNTNHDESDDIVMIGSDNYEEVATITRKLHSRREEDSAMEDQKNNAFSILDSEEIQRPPSTQKSIYLVIDTNFILSHLDILNDLLKLYHHYDEAYQLVIPRTTMQELDGLKNSKAKEGLSNGIISDTSISQLARWANEWCYSRLAESNPAIRGQKFDERLDFGSSKDESILDCCLYLKSKNPAHLVILLSNDKNFCMKALTNGILTISYRPKMSAKLIAQTIIQESLNRGNGDSHHEPIEEQQRALAPEDMMEIETSRQLKEPEVAVKSEPDRSVGFVTISDIEEACSLIFNEIETLLRSAVDKVMVENFGEDIELITYVTPSNMKDVFDCIMNYWVSVFHSIIRGVNFQNEFGKISNRNAKNSLIQLPCDLISLQKFTLFWENILKELYESKSDRDQKALEIFMNRWHHIMAQF